MNTSVPERSETSQYEVRSRAELLAWSALLIAIGSLSFVIPIVAGKGQVGGIFGLIFVGSGIWTTRSVCGVRLHPDGLIEFRRAVGTTTIFARNIRVLEGKLVQGYDDKEWKLFVRHANGSVKIDEFANARLFADRVQALDPHVGIAGTWPMGPPEAPFRAGQVKP